MLFIYDILLLLYVFFFVYFLSPLANLFTFFIFLIFRFIIFRKPPFSLPKIIYLISWDFLAFIYFCNYFYHMNFTLFFYFPYFHTILIFLAIFSEYKLQLMDVKNFVNMKFSITPSTLYIFLWLIFTGIMSFLHIKLNIGFFLLKKISLTGVFIIYSIFMTRIAIRVFR